MMIVIIIIVMCDTTLIDFCLEPSVLAMLCQMSPSRGVHSPQMHQMTMEVSFDDDDDDDDNDIDGKHIYIHIYIYIYICHLLMFPSSYIDLNVCVWKL